MWKLESAHEAALQGQRDAEQRADDVSSQLAKAEEGLTRAEAAIMGSQKSVQLHKVSTTRTLARSSWRVGARDSS